MLQKHCIGCLGISDVECFLSAREESESVKVVRVLSEGSFEVGHGVDCLSVDCGNDFSRRHAKVDVAGVFEYFREYDWFGARHFFGLLTAEEELIISPRAHVLAQLRPSEAR